MNATLYNQKGQETGKLELNDSVFGLSYDLDLIHQVVLAMQANSRTNVAHVKNRGEVSGGGKKPWRQKGTGRARHGSSRSPIWVGGGVTHGPTKERDYTQKINKKMKKKAFYEALSQKLRDGEILFLDKVSLKDAKTKEASGIFKTLSGIGGFEKLAGKKKNKAIVALPKKDEETSRAFRNIAGTEIYEARNLNLLDLLTYKYLIVVNPEEAVKGWK